VPNRDLEPRRAAEDPEDLLPAADVRALLDLVAGTDVEELEVEHHGARVLIRREPTRAAAAPPPVGQAAPEARGVEPADDPFAGLVVVRSSLVGLFFRGKEPGAEALAREGEAVRPGQPLAIVEALRVPHLLEAPVAGTLERVLVQDGHAVEYGQPILLLRPST